MAVIQLRWDSRFFNHQGGRYESSPFRDVLKFPFLEVLESPADVQLKIPWFQQMLGDQCQNLPVQWPELCRLVAAEFLLPPNVPVHPVNMLNYHDCLVKCMKFFFLKPMAIAFWVVRGVLTIFPLSVCTPNLSLSWEQCHGSGWSTQDKRLPMSLQNSSSKGELRVCLNVYSNPTKFCPCLCNHRHTAVILQNLLASHSSFSSTNQSRRPKTCNLFFPLIAIIPASSGFFFAGA